MPDSPMPAFLPPMLATPASTAPTDDDWWYEIKWDGVRAIVAVQTGRLTLTSRRGNDLSGRYPELTDLADAVDRPVLLDAEIVALDPQGRPSFERLQRRMHVRDPRTQERLAVEVPVALIIFDVLWSGGESLLDLPYTERRAHLTGLGLAGSHWQTPVAEAAAGPRGPALLSATRDLGLEGIVAKRGSSRYESGRRSRAWLKVKHHATQEFVVGGWLPGQGARRATLGALLVGVYDDEGRLQYAGRVGSGFTGAALEDWARRLAAGTVDASPFAPAPIPAEARWVRPDLVVEVGFTEWTGEGRLRHPVLRGLRDDVDPRTVRREPTVARDA
jgi:bifunctional non-homologous end joining protein LigD